MTNTFFLIGHYNYPNNFFREINLSLGPVSLLVEFAAFEFFTCPLLTRRIRCLC